MKQLSLRETQLEEQKILDATVSLLNKHHLTYFLYGGTLLGAIRHRGFIPWDDDIDIAMPRPDYDKLLSIIKKHQDSLPEPFELKAFELGNHAHPLGKVINKKIRIKSDSKQDVNLWIDVFPLDGLPESNRKANHIITELRKGKVTMHIKNSRLSSILKEHRSVANRISKIALKPFLLFKTRKFIAAKMINLAREIPYENSVFCCGHVWDYNGIPLRYRTSLFSPIEWDFEGKKYTIPAGYDEYLASTYGNYMKLPPKKDRATHGLIAFVDD